MYAQQRPTHLVIRALEDIDAVKAELRACNGEGQGERRETFYIMLL